MEITQDINCTNCGHEEESHNSDFRGTKVSACVNGCDCQDYIEPDCTDMTVEERSDYETNGMVPCTGNEGCVCDDCVKARAEFNAWCDQTEQRWADAALTAPSGVVLEVVR